MDDDDNNKNKSEDDVLLEAQAFLDTMEQEEEGIDMESGGNDDIALDGFVIDSDDEDNTNQNAHKEESVPLVVNSTPNGTGRRPPLKKESLDVHPLSEEHSVFPPSSQASTRTNAAATQNNNDTSATPNNNSSSPMVQQALQEKAMTFASQISSFAQRAATQIDKMSDKVAAASAATGERVVPSQPPPTSPNSIPVVELDNDTKTKLIRTHVGNLLPGERVIMFLSNLLHVSDSSLSNYAFVGGNDGGMWCCAMTYYRVLLFHTSPQTKLLQIPLASMDKVEKSVYSTPGNKPTTLMGLVLYGKDNGRQVRFTTTSYGDTLRAHEALLTYAFPGRRNLGYLFAFESKRNDVMSSIVVDDKGHKKISLPPTRNRFLPQKEFTRQGLLDNNGSSPWTMWTGLNAQYQLCTSYPSIIMGPACLDESSPNAVRLVRQCAAFRSEQRLPALTWACSVGGGSLWRCSQPKVGLQGNRSTADEAFLQKIAQSAATANHAAALLQQHTAAEIARLTGSMAAEWTLRQFENRKESLKIMDLRPKSSAMANRTGGYGYENTSYYTYASIQFCNIGNIHAVRDAYQKLSALSLNHNAAETQWMSLVEDTKWLTQIRLLLSASWQTAFWIHVHGMPVLLHCSHGWDRTSQVAALAQLLLDPYYRTMEGFVTLVEKDFMSFGHPFHTRCAHGEGRNGGDQKTSSSSAASAASSTVNDEGQISPIFIQFLDCVYQMVHQYPEKFEFNTRFLLLISEHVYSCRFGNMLCDTEREREVVAGIRQRTHCLWDYLQERKEELLSVVYDDEDDAVLWVPLPTLLRNVTLWSDRHCMHGPKQSRKTIESTKEENNDKFKNDQQSDLVTSEDYYSLEITKARNEAEEWKRIAQERLDELNALQKTNGDEEEKQ